MQETTVKAATAATNVRPSDFATAAVQGATHTDTIEECARVCDAADGPAWKCARGIRALNQPKENGR